MAQARKKVKPTSTEDPKFQKKRLAGIKKGVKNITTAQSTALSTVNTSKKADKGMPVKSKPGSLTNPGGYFKTAARYYRKKVKKALTGGTVVGRAKTQKNKTLGSIANPGR